MIAHLLMSQEFSAFATLFGLLGDFAILILTIYTLYITAFSHRLEMVSPSYTATTFFGDSISITLMNKSLHAIPVQSVFLLKKYKGDIYMISIADYKDPIAIDSWSVKRIDSDPFTKISNEEGNKVELIDLLQNAVIGLQSGKKIVWVKPYKNTPLKEAKIAFKKHNFRIMSVWKKTIDDTVISDRVDVLLYVRLKDVNGQFILKKIFGISDADDGRCLLLSDYICGYNSISNAGATEVSILRAIHDLLGIPKKDIVVQMIGDIVSEESDEE